VLGDNLIKLDSLGGEGGGALLSCLMARLCMDTRGAVWAGLEASLIQRVCGTAYCAIPCSYYDDGAVKPELSA
jgi:hypothetical protein